MPLQGGSTGPIADQANTWGLIMDMLGIVIVFFWGPPLGTTGDQIRL